MQPRHVSHRSGSLKHPLSGEKWHSRDDDIQRMESRVLVTRDIIEQQFDKYGSQNEPCSRGGKKLIISRGWGRREGGKVKEKEERAQFNTAALMGREGGCFLFFFFLSPYC